MGWLGWAGWLAGWAGLAYRGQTYVVPKSSMPFGRGPPAVGPQPMKQASFREDKGVLEVPHIT